jgi:hypothetical protein
MSMLFSRQAGGNCGGERLHIFPVQQSVAARPLFRFCFPLLFGRSPFFGFYHVFVWRPGCLSVLYHPE